MAWWQPGAKPLSEPMMVLFTDAYLHSSSLVNSLVPGRSKWKFWYVILEIIIAIRGEVISCVITLRWISLDVTNDKSTLVQVMASCYQA